MAERTNAAASPSTLEDPAEIPFWTEVWSNANQEPKWAQEAK
jgi:hypothetical protein